MLRQLLSSLLAVILLVWVLYTYAYWWGIIDRDKYGVKGTLNSGLILFFVPLACVFLLGLLNRKKKDKSAPKEPLAKS